MKELNNYEKIQFISDFIGDNDLESTSMKFKNLIEDVISKLDKNIIHLESLAEEYNIIISIDTGYNVKLAIKEKTYIWMEDFNYYYSGIGGIKSLYHSIYKSIPIFYDLVSSTSYGDKVFTRHSNEGINFIKTMYPLTEIVHIYKNGKLILKANPELIKAIDNCKKIRKLFIPEGV
jgi:hypothetical protein